MKSLHTIKNLYIAFAGISLWLAVICACGVIMGNLLHIFTTAFMVILFFAFMADLRNVNKKIDEQYKNGMRNG